MEKIKSKKVKLVIGIIGILFVLAAGFFIGSGYTSHFFLNYFKDIHAGNVYEQISYLMILRDGLTKDAIDNMDERLVYGLYSFTVSDPKGLPEDITKWPDSTLRTWQRAKEYYEHYPELLEGQSEQYNVVRRILEKIPDSERKIKEKDFAKRYTGKAAPALDVSKWISQPVTLDKLHGKVVLLDFWGNWCGPCRAKLPRTQELHVKYQDKGLEVIGIHSLKDAEKAADFISQNKYTFRTGLDTGQTAKSYSVTGWPTYYLIDKQGRLTWGPEHSAPPEELIESLLATQEILAKITKETPAPKSQPKINADAKSIQEAINIAIPALYKDSMSQVTDYILISVQQILVNSKWVWRVTFKPKDLLPDDPAKGIIGLGGEVFVNVDLSTKETVLTYGE